MSYGYSGNYGPPPGAPPGHNHGSGGYGGHGGGVPYSGGFSHPPHSGPPPGSDPQLWNWFTSVDTDRSGQISATELQRALVNGDWTAFDLDTVKLLMSIFDVDRSGAIGFNEFSGLWKYIKDWQNVFRHFDKDRSGSIDGGELRGALKQFGYDLSPQLLAMVEKKYDMFKASDFVGHGSTHHGSPFHGAASAGISFDRFVRACVVIKQLTEAFQKLDTDRDGWIQINYDQFMHMVLSAP